MKTLVTILLLNFQVPHTSLEVCDIEDWKIYYKEVSKPVFHTQRIDITCGKQKVGYFYYRYNHTTTRDDLVGMYIKRTNKYYFIV